MKIVLKSLLSLFFLTFLYPVILSSQEPIKKNNAIVVKGVTFGKVKETLLDAGIFIDEQNSEDGTIVTKRKGYCNCPNKDFYQLIYYIRVKDTIATIRGKWNVIIRPNDNDVNNFMEVEYWKDKNSGPHYIFGIMTDFAKALKGNSVEFKTL